MRVVIIGGVAAGMSAATRLRRLDEHVHITVVERGEAVSFANCGLPYAIGGVIPDREALLLQTPDSLKARFDIDVLTRTEATWIDRHSRTVAVRSRDDGAVSHLPYDHLVLATGAKATIPPIPGAERALTLRDLSDMDRIIGRLDGPHRPRSAAILGAGFIGLELAENLARRGLAVSIVEAADQILTPFDPEMAWPIREHLEAHGIAVATSTTVTAIAAEHVLTADGRRIEADLLIAATGVAPESSLARAAGLQLGPRDGIAVGPSQRTSDPAIFAVGDVAVKKDAIDGSDVIVPLALSANRHGRLVADAICGRPAAAAPSLGTAIVGVFGLSAALTGWNERRARSARRAIHVIHAHPLDHAGYYPGAQQMALKLVVDANTDLILGAQGVGPAGVDKRIDVIATAMRAGLRASELADLELAYAPQFGAAKDPVMMLGMISDNLAQGVIVTLQWHELAEAMADGATLVDVRTAAEFAAGAIPGAINIPVDELRQRASEIPPGLVVVSCAVGHRGNVAARILGQHGRNVANLDGGYRTWAAGSAAQHAHSAP